MDWLSRGLVPSRTGTQRRLVLSNPEGASWHFAFIAGNDSISSMATLTIRQLDEKTKMRLRVRAAHHGRSMEEEAREILRSVLEASRSPKFDLAQAIRRRFALFGGVELELPRRDSMRRAPDLAK
jgi:antitoxin FitA